LPRKRIETFLIINAHPAKQLSQINEVVNSYTKICLKKNPKVFFLFS